MSGEAAALDTVLPDQVPVEQRGYSALYAVAGVSALLGAAAIVPVRGVRCQHIGPVYLARRAPYSPKMNAVALVSVIASGVVAVAGLFLTYRSGRDQRQQELRLEEVRLKKEFLIERYRHRLTAYSSVIRSLGAVTVVELTDDRPTNNVLPTPERLQRAAAELEEHLYGEAGLLMTMQTRNWIHVARQEALSFLSGHGTDDDTGRLVDAFYYARRAIRRDLDLEDDQEPTSVESLAARLSERSDRRS